MTVTEEPPMTAETPRFETLEDLFLRRIADADGGTKDAAVGAEVAS